MKACQKCGVRHIGESTCGAQSWSDNLQLQEVDTEPAPVVERPDPLAEQMRAVSAVRYAKAMEIRAKELEMGLYLAKARIAELELEKLKRDVE